MKPPPSDESPPNPAFGAQSNRPRSDSDDDQAVEPALVFVDTAADGEGDAQPPMEHIGRYTLRYRIGEGRLGTLYAAYDPVLSRLVAVKTVQPALDAEERVAFNSVFLNEARAAASLSHPYIATVYDAGISEQGAYVAMELLKGGDLRQLGVDGWRPSPKQAAMIVQRVADALAYAHSRGVVHCDIKPANIFMVGPTQP
ncbi:MAG: serine/threonine protein kinase, partial [Burkholderiaceae bacterium]|nr:serine/threonine protein kinase [Burkholderiaceae bacterium]